MEKRRTHRLVVAASLVAAAGWPVSALAQEAAPAAPPVSPEQPAAPAVASAPAAKPPAPGEGRIKFNFKDAPFDLVLDFFQRESGLPKIDEAPVPQGTMTFISGESYSFDDALTILNLNLLPKGVQLRREGKFLYLGTLKDAARKAADVAKGTVPAEARPEQILNLTIPLSNARAELVIEQIKPLVAEYGSVLAVPAQNLLIVVETAAQCRRIQEIVQAIDAQKPVDATTQVFKLKYAKADTVHAALRGLVGEKRTTVLVDEKGNRKQVSEDAITGLNLQPDPRTNSIIAVGSATRIKVVEELIALLDVPEGGLGEQKMMTFALETVAPDRAAAELAKLFTSVEASRRPTIIPLGDSGKVTMVGPASLLMQAVALLGEIDPGSQPTDGVPQPSRSPERRAAVIRLTHITPQNVEQLAPRLLTQRQQSAVKFAPAPDGRGLVVSGLDADVTAFEKLVQGLDVAPEFSKEIRQVRIATGNPKAVLDRALELHAATGRDKTDPVTSNLDAESRTVTLIGGRAAIDRFSELLKSTESSVVVDLESRTYELARVRPSLLAPKLARVLRPLLTPDDGGVYAEPKLEPLDELRTLIVRAAPEQFAVIESMIKRLDQEEAGAQQFRFMRLGAAAGDPQALVDRAMKLYQDQTKGMPADQAGPVLVDVDRAAGTLLISASAGGLQRFGDLLNQLQQMAPPTRTTRLVDVQKARASDIVGPLKEFLASADSIDPSRKVPEPSITVVERTNSLMVTAEDAQHRLIQDYVQRLDRSDAALPPLKLLQLRAAEAAAVAAMLNEQYDRRPQAERAQKPVEVRADAATNTLIVSAHPDLFEEIRTFVSDLNSKEKLEGAAKQTQMFQLKMARAVNVAAAMDKLYPVPPVPVDRQNRPMPWLQQPKPVTVSADPDTNTLMIYGPADQMDSIRALAEKLDHVELPPQAQMKTYRVVGSNLDAIARTLQGMAGKGILVAPAQPGKPQVQVMIETEPKSSTLIVAGDDVTFERVEAMLKDLSAVPIEKGLRIFPVANLRASDVKTRAQAIYDAQVSQIPGANPVEITVDEKNNQLMVVADGEAMARFARVMDELAKQAGPPRDVRMIELRFAKAEKVKTFLDELIRSSESLRIRGGADPVVEVIETSNSLMIAAQPSQFPIIEALAKNLDNKESTERPPMRILKLRATDAANLAAVLQQSFDRRPTEQRAKQPVDIQADAATNTLIVSADPAMIPEIEQIVSELNQQDLDQDGREIRIFPLKVARAEELAKTIDAMYPEPPIPLDPRTRQPRPDLKLPKEVTVRADRGTNSLIVDAPGKRLAGFEQIVKSLDQAKLAGNVELRSYKVERADLQAAAAALRNAAANGALYAQGQAGAALSPVTVDAEPTSRTLIVSGPSEVFKGVEEVLKKIDALPDRPTTGVKMYALKNGRAERLQPILQKVILGRVREQLQASGQSVADLNMLVDVAADAGSNTIVVSAPENVLVITDALMSTLDQQAGGGASEMRVFRLTRGDAASAAKAITASLAADPTGEPAPSITAEPASNSIVIVGTTRQLEKAGKLVEELDATVEKGGVGIRTVKLKFARAEAILPVLETLLKKESVVSMLPRWEVSSYLAQTGGKGENQVRVAAERSTNSVIVSAPVAVLDMAEQVIAELDVDPAAMGRRNERPVRIITLGNADATELAANIEAVLATEPASGEEPPTVRVDKSSNSLIVRASPEQLAGVEELAKKLDAATVNSSRQMRMIPVDRSRADAALMAQTLRRLLEQQGGVKVEVITTEQLLKKADEPKADARPAGHSDASGAAGMKGGLGAGLATFRVIAALGAAQPESPSQPEAEVRPAAADEPTGVTIAVDPATNSLVVVGSPRMTDRLAALAAELERQMPAEPSRVRIVALPASADADGLAAIVRQTVQQLGRASATNPGGFTGPVTVSADPAGGALIVWANDTDFESVGGLIGAVSQLEPATSLTVKVYPLATVTASKAIQAVNDLLSPQPRGRQAQRFRGSLDIAVVGSDGKETQAKIDPGLVRLTADPAGASIIVAAPASTLPLIDRFIALIDQSPVSDRLAIRRYDLKNAKASDLAQTLGQLFEAQRQGPARDELPQAKFIADARTNSILVTASDPQHSEVVRLLATMDTELVDTDLKLEIITLQNALPSTVQKIVDQVVVGRNPALKERVQVSAQDQSSIIVVKAPAEQLAEIKGIIAQVDKGDMGSFPVRFVKLERADAQSVSQALQRFFQDRAQAASRGGQRPVSRVSIVGDRRSGTLIVSASDADFEQLTALVATFDAPSKAQAMQFRIVPLQNARVTDIQETVQSIAAELQWERQGGNFFFWDPWGGGRNRNDDGPAEDKLFVQTNERTNSVVLMGQGDTLETMLKIIAELDKPQSEQTRLVVRSVRVDRGDLRAMADIIRQATVTPNWRSWRGPDPESVTVQVDAARRVLMLIGKQPRVEQAMAYVEELKNAGGAAEAVLESIPLKHAQAARAAETLKRVFADRAQTAGLPSDQVSVVGSQDGNVLMISADPKSLALAKDLLGQIDQPELGKDRRIEAHVVRNRDADEIANLLRAQFPRTQGRSESQVIVTPQPSTNMVIVSAQADDHAAILALLKQVDVPPSEENSRVATVPLKSASADDVAAALRAALPKGLQVKITPVRRNNTILLTGSEESLKVVLDQIKEIDVELERPLVEFRRVTLKNAIASDVYFTLEQMLRARPRGGPSEPQATVDYTRNDNTVTFSGTADQVRDISKMIEALDVPNEENRKREFVKLEFAKAEATAKALEVFYGRFAPEASTPAARAVTIVPDPASNSLVVSAAESEWEGLRALLKKLDTEDYDTSRQLAVLPLKHADATSVARAINEGFRAPVEGRLRREQARQQGQPGRNGQRNQESQEPLVLVDSESTPTVSAEVQTNSLVVFAGRQDLVRIQALVAQIDVPDFVKFAEARVLPLKTGKATQIAQSLRELFVAQNQRSQGPRATVIVGDDVANALIIRAEERDYAQISALAEALQQQGDISQATVRVLGLKNVPAARLQKSLSTTFAQAAKQQNEVLSIEVDRTSNSLVIASSRRIYDEIEKVAKELDGAVPAAQPDGVKATPGALGQSVFIIDVQNNGPEEVRKQLEQLGVTRPQADDRPGVVSEAVTIVPLTSRRALAVIASPQDGEAIVSLVRALDAAPAEADQRVTVVALKLATAAPVVATLKSMLNPGEQASQTGPAKAVAEQVRRLNVARNGIGQGDLVLDLSKPIRLIADEQTNSVIIGSTPENVASVQEVIKTLDSLPMGDAVVVRIFPLTNASATRAKSVIDDLFSQGEALRRLPGTRRQGLPTTATGKALAGEIAVSVDDRTNTLVVAGREEAVALVEVLMKDLDSDQAAKWIEPTLIELKFADAVPLATTLRQVLVQGLNVTPEALGLQKQIGRLRMAKFGRDMSDPANRLEADLFAPLSGLVIAPEPQLNALIVVGSAPNIAIVRELASMLDVEAASAANSVRVFPLVHAAADRVSATVAQIFRERQADPSARAEDRVIIAPDPRTNSLIVSTSPRSFSILDAMLRTLDSEQANSTVSLHVIPVIGIDVATLAPKIDKLMRERIAAAQRSGEVKSPLDTFSIEADAASNLLIVACSNENLQLVNELVATLKQGNAALAGAAKTDLIQIKAGRATDIAATLRQLYLDRENARRGDGSVTVVPSERLNALVVTGTDADIARLRELVEQQERAPVATTQEIRRIGLRSANAIEVVTVLQGVLAGRPVSGGSDIAARQATNLRFFREQVAQNVQGAAGSKPSEAQIDGAIREQITLSPELRTNSVVVKAPSAVMEVILDIIDDLDSTSAGARGVKTLTLTNADARQTATLLRDIFTLRQAGDTYILVPTQFNQMDPATGADGQPQNTLTPVPDQRQQLSIAVDARTNSLIVSGTEEYLERVEAIVTDLDSKQGTERESRVYAIRNTKAKELETTLQAYFRGEADKRNVLDPNQTGSAQRQLEQEVTVVGDEKSNKLIISTSPRYMDMVLSMVKELDAAPPQVQIQVLLAEVTTDSNGQWGFDFRAREVGGKNFNIASLAAGAGVAAALGLPNLTFASADFDFIIRALEAQGKLQVLSSPYLQARNNEAASIQVGDNIAVVEGNTQITPQGGTIASVMRKDIGIILNVTPSISPDGFVRMEVAPEISSLSQRTTQVTADFQAPIIAQRKVKTTVTVKDGQTVVIGGLLQTQTENRKTKVPVLGDIPIAGWLFRTKQDADVKTELLVILTPRVIYSDTPKGAQRQEQILNQKINSSESPSNIRDALQKNSFFDESPVPTDPIPAEPAPPAASEPEPPARRGNSDTYVPPRRSSGQRPSR